MERIRQFLYENNKTSPVLVPRVLKDMVSRYVCPSYFITCFASFCIKNIKAVRCFFLFYFVATFMNISYFGHVNYLFDLQVAVAELPPAYFFHLRDRTGGCLGQMMPN